MRPVKEQFDTFAMGYAQLFHETRPAIEIADADLTDRVRNTSNGARVLRLPLDYGEAERLRDWLGRYLEAGGR